MTDVAIDDQGRSNTRCSLVISCRQVRSASGHSVHPRTDNKTFVCLVTLIHAKNRTTTCIVSFHLIVTFSPTRLTRDDTNFYENFNLVKIRTVITAYLVTKYGAAEGKRFTYLWERCLQGNSKRT